MTEPTSEELDRILDRINYNPREGLYSGALSATQMKPVTFPSGLAPRPVRSVEGADENAPLPHADVVIMTFTTAEGFALADVLSPGLETAKWNKYRNGWPALKAMIVGNRAPSLNMGYSALWAETNIGDKRVILIKSELHPATDGINMPLRALWKQILEQTQAKFAITTGTAGGLGDVQLGDVTVSNNVQANELKTFKGSTFAHEIFASDEPTISEPLTKMLAVNGPSLGEYYKRPVAVIRGDIESTDLFAFGDATDSYGLLKDDPNASEVEMDDVGLALAEQDLKAPSTVWVAVRNASDPSMPHLATLEDEDKLAAQIYRKYGYFTTVNSALVCWAIVASL